jgi:hypothetical protein
MPRYIDLHSVEGYNLLWELRNELRIRHGR